MTDQILQQIAEIREDHKQLRDAFDTTTASIHDLAVSVGKVAVSIDMHFKDMDKEEKKFANLFERTGDNEVQIAKISTKILVISLALGSLWTGAITVAVLLTVNFFKG